MKPGVIGGGVMWNEGDFSKLLSYTPGGIGGITYETTVNWAFGKDVLNGNTGHTHVVDWTFFFDP